jgi:hypothetical protein
MGVTTASSSRGEDAAQSASIRSGLNDIIGYTS